MSRNNNKMDLNVSVKKSQSDYGDLAVPITWMTRMTTEMVMSLSLAVKRRYYTNKISISVKA